MLMLHICVQTLPMTPHSHSIYILNTYYCKKKSLSSLPNLLNQWLFLKEMLNTNVPIVGGIYLKHITNPPTMNFGFFLFQSLLCCSALKMWKVSQFLEQLTTSSVFIFTCNKFAKCA